MCGKCFLVEFYVAPCRPVLENYLMPVTRPEFVFYARSTPNSHFLPASEPLAEHQCKQDVCKAHLTIFLCFLIFNSTLFSDYSCSSMEYAVQENHRHMNFLSSGKIIWILAESCVLYFIVIIFRIITAQQIQYNELKLHVQ